jgi:hypothetical protein
MARSTVLARPERESLVPIRDDGDDDDRDPRERRHLLDATEELPSVHVREQEVQGDQGQWLLHGERQRLLGGDGVEHGEALRLGIRIQQCRGVTCIHRVTLFDVPRLLKRFGPRVCAVRQCRKWTGNVPPLPDDALSGHNGRLPYVAFRNLTLA